MRQKRYLIKLKTWEDLEKEYGIKETNKINNYNINTINNEKINIDYSISKDEYEILNLNSKSGILLCYSWDNKTMYFIDPHGKLVLFDKKVIKETVTPERYPEYFI